jgi:hypothetical protein
MKLRWEGIAPLIMHNPILADPLSPEAIRMSELTSKRKKTQDDARMIMKYEWEAGLYYDEEIGVYAPSRCIFATIRNGARKNKRGKDVQCALRVTEEKVPLIYDGPKTKEKLYDDKSFVDRRPAKVNRGNLVMRTRPIFHEWAIEFEVIYNEELLNQSDLMLAVETAGTQVGFLDQRPEYGLFTPEFS